MISTPPKSVAIVGAGLAGLTLAISLHQRGVSCQIYELREPSVTTPGALMLSPNALRILESLGLYERLSRQGFNFETVTYKNSNGITTDKYYLGDSNLYKYKALRIYRKTLLSELRAEINRLKIPVTYGVKFSQVVSEDDNGVCFEFNDGSRATADILIGADGIHSTVRKYIAAEVTPKYSGQVAIHGKQGAFVMAPQNVDGSEILAGTQRAWPEQDRAGWDRLLADKEQLLELFRTDIESWPAIVQSALDNVPVETLAIWPYYVVPKLDRWFSPLSRVIIIGDAAHAIPPTAGQGASQGFEDAFTLAALLSHVSPRLPLLTALQVWKDIRQERIDKVIKLTLQLNNARLPEAERAKLPAGEAWTSGDSGELAWLYNTDVEQQTMETIKAKTKPEHKCPVSWMTGNKRG